MVLHIALALCVSAALAQTETTVTLGDGDKKGLVDITVGEPISTLPIPGLMAKDVYIATIFSLGWVSSWLGLDMWYLGYWALGILKAFSFGGLGIWAMIDVINISHCRLNDANDNILVGCPERPHPLHWSTPLSKQENTKKACDPNNADDKNCDDWN